MTERTAKVSPQLYARIGGALYLYIIAAGSFGEAVRSQVVVSADAAATASNITAHESLFRIGHTGELMHLAGDVAVAMIFYVLLRPVDRNLALLAAFFRLASDVILGITELASFAALRLVGEADYLKAIPPDQRHSLALLAMKLHADGYAISLVFFGVGCIPLGYLILKAGYFPRVLGVLMIIAGLAYLINSLAHFLDPAVAAKLFPAILLPAFLAELSLTLWLLVKGVNVAKWDEAAKWEENASAPAA
jgi:hypothetical protein